MLRYQKGYICNGYTFVVNKEDVHNATDDMFVNATALLPDGWISVEERLPEDDLPKNTKRLSIKVLVASSNGRRNGVRTISRQRWVTNCNPLEYHKWEWSRDAECITHWMPLPEPPEEEAYENLCSENA